MQTDMRSERKSFVNLVINNFCLYRELMIFDTFSFSCRELTLWSVKALMQYFTNLVKKENLIYWKSYSYD